MAMVRRREFEWVYPLPIDGVLFHAHSVAD
jgi:hypothetical protein